MSRVGREFGRSPQECRRRGDTATSLSSIGGDLQVLGQIVVRMPCGLGQMPRAAVRIDRCISGVSERLVHLASVGWRCRLVDSRTDQRMTENYLWRHLEQTVRFDLGPCRLTDSEVLGGTPQKGRIAGRLGSGNKEEALGRSWGLRYPS